VLAHIGTDKGIEGKQCCLHSVLRPTGLSSVPLYIAACAGAMNSMEQCVNSQVACRDEIAAPVLDQMGGWYHRFGCYGDGYSYWPSQFSPSQWPLAYWEGENEHRTDNYTQPHNNQSQPGPSTLVPGAWDGHKYNRNITYTDIETDLPDQPYK